jgi:hypothetical protein
MSAESQIYEAIREPFQENGPANIPVARQWLSKGHLTAVTLKQETIEERLEAVFSVRSAAKHT